MKNSIVINLMAFLMLLATSSIAHNITGKVIDKTAQSPLEFATITILNTENKQIVTGAITDDAGLFELKVESGSYDIIIDFLSFQNYTLENQVIFEDFDLKIIELEPNTNVLEGVEVVEERSTIEYKLDKKVFNVGKDIISKGGNASDILDNVPSVTVDAEGTIALRGNANVQILIDGKPSVLAANGGLESLSADLVAKVEVITNPSARYEASGTAGIINIILKKNKVHGLGGSIQLTTGFPAQHRANLNMNYKKEKFNIFTNIGYRYSNYFGERTRDNYVTNENITTHLQQFEDSERNDKHFNFYVGGDYYINKKNTLTVSYYKDVIENTDKSETSYNYFNQSNSLDSALTQVENYSEPQNYNELQLDYVKTFDNKDRKFTTSIIYDWWNDDENEMISQSYDLPINQQTIHILTRDIESSKDLLIQSDFVTPLAKNGQFETGFRGEIRSITSDYSASINNEPIAEFNNLLNYDERIYGVYAQYGQKLKKFNYLLGLRTEISDISINDRIEKFNDDKNYIGFFPTAHFTYNFSEMMNLQLSYSRRIQRPHFWQLNPFGGLSDIRNKFVGNPDLNPMYTDSYELGVLKRWKNLTINPSLYFQRSNDFFQFVSIADENGLFLTMPINLSNENRLGVELSSSYTPVKWLRLSADLNYYQFEQFGEYKGIDFDTEDDNWSARINSRLKFDGGLTSQITFRYQAQNQNGQTLTKAQKSLDFGISKDLLKDKANLSLNFRNILDSRIRNQITTGENYIAESIGKRSGRRISATFTYRFNRKKSERDRMRGR